MLIILKYADDYTEFQVRHVKYYQIQDHFFLQDQIVIEKVLKIFIGMMKVTYITQQRSKHWSLIDCLAFQSLLMMSNQIRVHLF